MTKPADSDQIEKARRISEIAEREKKATKGPYTITGGNYLGIIAVIDGKSSQIGRAEGCGDRVSDEQVEDNARFFAHARTDIPFLLSELASERQAVIEDCAKVADRIRMNGINTPREAAEHIARAIRSME